MGCSPWGHEESDTTERLHFHFHALEKEMATHSCSCLENPRDGGAWWTAVYGVVQSWTRLKRLSSSSSIYIYIYTHTHKYLHRRRRRRQRMRWLDGITDAMCMNLGKLRLACSMESQRVRHDWMTEQRQHTNNIDIYNVHLKCPYTH